jgi:hypothetical protein
MQERLFSGYLMNKRRPRKRYQLTLKQVLYKVAQGPLGAVFQGRVGGPLVAGKAGARAYRYARAI